MKFNHIISIDLKHKNGKLIIYMINVVTRYTRAAFIENKCTETVISKVIVVIHIWSTELFLMDNEGNLETMKCEN